MNTKKHYDAAGHEVLDWQLLKNTIRHEESRKLINSQLLSRVLIFPFTVIRVFSNQPGCIEMIQYGTGPEKSRHIEINSKQLSALRRLYSRKGGKGWTVSTSNGVTSFFREARVIRDPLRRYGG